MVKKAIIKSAFLWYTYVHASNRFDLIRSRANRIPLIECRLHKTNPSRNCGGIIITTRCTNNWLAQKDHQSVVYIQSTFFRFYVLLLDKYLCINYVPTTPECDRTGSISSSLSQYSVKVDWRWIFKTVSVHEYLSTNLVIVCL